MAETANEAIRDGLIRHQIGSRRAARGLAARIVRIIDRSEESVRAKVERGVGMIKERGLDVGTSALRRVAALEAAVAELLAEPHTRIRSTTETFLVDLAEREPLFVKALIETHLPVQVKMKIPAKTALRSIVKSRPFQGRVLRDWMRQFEAGDRRRMMDQVRIGLVNGESAQEIGQRIFGTRSLRGRDGARVISRRGAEMLAETATSYVVNHARAAFVLANPDLIREEIWVSVLDSKTSETCLFRAGERYDAGVGPYPPAHPRCRSERHPVIYSTAAARSVARSGLRREMRGKSEREKRRALRALIGPAPAATDAESFLRRQSAAFQEEMLGKRRAALWRGGKVPLKSFIDERRNRFLTIDQLMAREPSLFA